jgi:hypothetical protein
MPSALDERALPIEAIRQKIRTNVTVDENGCWLWRLYVRPNGYGQVAIGKPGIAYVHRAAHEAWKGPIPDGLQIDHLCRVRSCCNPEHLEAVTGRVNVLRGTGFSAQHAVATACPAGHPYDDANTYLRPGRYGRDCRSCRQEVEVADRRRRMAELKGIPVGVRPMPSIRLTSCPDGHPRSGVNLYIDPRGRAQCKECRRAAARRSYAKRHPPREAS